MLRFAAKHHNSKTKALDTSFCQESQHHQWLLLLTKISSLSSLSTCRRVSRISRVMETYGSRDSSLINLEEREFCSSPCWPTTVTGTSHPLALLGLSLHPTCTSILVSKSIAPPRLLHRRSRLIVGKLRRRPSSRGVVITGTNLLRTRRLVRCINFVIHPILLIAVRFWKPELCTIIFEYY